MDEIFTSNGQKCNGNKMDLLHKFHKDETLESIDVRVASLLDKELINPREEIIKHILEFSKSL